ncbi:MATE family efflux transporter [Alloprevotella tannerae]|uniref:MATE family efflux transporter n=1 Tax=Alloprevotella tannerae TaxID=76122 RepID=UPI0025D9385E|nr:MATE family efflux transporter [Alloprevotella tannerae]
MISKTLFSHYQQTLKLGLPISIGQIGTIVLSFADTMMVGRYDTPSLAAASFVNSVFNLVIFLLIGYSFGLTPQVGALFGQGETASVGAVVRQALRANSLFAALLMLIMGVGYFFVDRMGQPESLLPLIRPYYLVILASMPFVMLFNVLRQLSDGTMHTKTAMWALWAGNALNILGNWLLIYGVGPFPELGLLGAGLSTLISRIFIVIWISAALLLERCYKPYLKGFFDVRFDWSELRHINAQSLPVSIQMGAETAAFTCCGVMAGWIGKVELAAFQVIMTVSTLGFMFYYSLASAMSIRVSTFQGMKEWLQLERSARAGRDILLAVAVVASFVFYFFGPSLIGFFTKDAAVVQMAVMLIPGLIFYQYADAMQICYANALRGTAYVKPMAPIALVAYLCIGIPVGYLLGFIVDWKLNGLFLGLPAGLFTAAALFYYYFRKAMKRNLQAPEGGA